MKCTFCKGELETEIAEHKEFGISFGKFQAMVCKKCGEQFYGSEITGKIQEKAKAIGLFGQIS